LHLQDGGKSFWGNKMASINVEENDFTILANAADEAAQRGDTAAAGVLDILARKTNAALANDTYKGVPMRAGMKRLSWKDVPSTIGA